MPNSQAAIKSQIRAAQREAERETKQVVERAVREFDAEVRKVQRQLRQL